MAKKGKLWFSLLICIVLISIIPPTQAIPSMLHNSNDVVRNQSMTMVFNFWDQYTDQTMQIYNPPDYFGGFIINEDGTLTVCITDISEKTRNEMFSTVKSRDISFKEVEFSFNNLVDQQHLVNENYNSNIVTTTICIPDNVVNIYTKGDALITQKQVSAISGIDDRNLQYIKYVSDEMVAETTHNLAVTTEAVYNRLKGNNNELSSTSIYPGQKAFIMGTSGYGTVGFTATDSNNRNVIVTHGHGYIDYLNANNEFTDCLTSTINGASYSIYILSVEGQLNKRGSVTDHLDAAYIPTTTAITNKINNSSTTKLTGVVYNYQMESVSGITGKYFGATNGTQSGLVTVSDGYLSMLMSSAISERAGDSGGTIYLTNTSQNRLIGIVKGQSGNTMINGIPWTSIASAYYSCTGLILSPKIN